MNSPPFPHDYILEFISGCTREFVLTAPKKRFHTLPGLLRKIAWHSTEYKEFAEQMEKAANEQGCSVHDLEDKREWPDFKW